MARSKLLTSQNAKTIKGEKRGYKTFVLYLASGDKSLKEYGKAGGLDVCPNKSRACFTFCLDNAGRGRFDHVKLARLVKTKQYRLDPAKFTREVSQELARKVKWWSSNRPAWQLVLRADGTSDIGIGRRICQDHPSVQFMDYTKHLQVIRRDRKIPYGTNYHLTFSWSGENEKECREALDLGYNVAAPFLPNTKSGAWYPPEFMGYPVISGETADLGILDPAPAIVALRPKGRAVYDASGFVVRGAW